MIERIRNRFSYVTPAFLIGTLLVLVIVAVGLLWFLFFGRADGEPPPITVQPSDDPTAVPSETPTFTPTSTSTATEESLVEPALTAMPTSTTIPTMTATATEDTPTITVTPVPKEPPTPTPTPTPTMATEIVIACVTALNASGPGFILYDLPGRLPKSRGIGFQDELLVLEGPYNDGQGILWWSVRKVSDGEEGWAAIGPLQDSSLIDVHDC